MNHKLEFYSRLESSYLGSKIKDIKDKSGFTNLLEIKAKYFKHLKSKLENFIGADTHENQDIYNKLYTFFDTYLNETGTPFFNTTPIYKNIYARVYSNSSDTSLFYKTQDLYYVKSDTLYKSMEFEGENYILKFDASEFKQNADNTKNKIIFKIASIEKEEQDLTINIKVSNQKELFENLSNVFKQNSSEFSEDFIKSIKPYKLDEEALKKDFSSYKRQNEVDFFIHKNAREFLNEQFDLWLFSYLHKDDKLSDFTQETLAKITKIKDAAKLTINLIADFEDELKAIWLKPKFAKKVHYVFSLDKIAKQIKEQSLWQEFLLNLTQDKGFKAQLKEWQDLKLASENFNANEFLETLQEAFILSLQGEAEAIQTNNNGLSRRTNTARNDDKKQYLFLPLDTKHFSKEMTFKILSLFDNLENHLDGELIKSDNFQALNTLMPKYQNKIDLIYIDPPFNTGSDFEYKDKFQDSTWLSLMHNRLELARDLLSSKGSFYLHLDHNANYRGRELLNNVFGEDNFVNEIVWAYKSFVGQTTRYYPRKHDIINLYVKNLDLFIFKLERNLNKWKRNNPNKEPSKDDVLYIFQSQPLDSCWNDISYLDPKDKMERIESDISLTQKPEALLQRIIEASSKQNSIILDFFTGSGTTIATAQKLGRKWLGVEMGEHFYKVIIPRMKKVIAGFASGISKEVDYKGGGAFKYYELESYDEALANCEYVLDSIASKQSERSNPQNLQKHQAIIDYKKSRKLIKTIQKDKIAHLDMSAYREDFDIFTTLSNLNGVKIKRIFLDNKGKQTCEFDNGDIVQSDSIDIQKYPRLKNLIFWEK
ncbi:site-specific DNA-methyltransferase [Campylobacter sp. MIT 12-8780]|uniref:site-specific DNA-methyltransferase n=1 Tax=Campylobacter sp. MIT 12-8780 TaxID=2202200 RepID=UPI00115DF4E4|nr:site-specific DNA-methyltransferase [Campylobacter sp. MIT 12-8780]TQR40805.1 site-specific DNA-methyltransferase [Campylobacter sp. MIT 12-8780]